MFGAPHVIVLSGRVGTYSLRRSQGVLVLRPGALGDALLAVPALRALRARCGKLTFAAHGGAARLLQSVGEVDRGIAFDDPSLAWVFADARPPDQDGRHLVAWLSGHRPPALADALVFAPGRPREEDGVHCARYLLGTLPWPAAFDDRPLGVRPLPSDEVLVHPGSGSPRKNWPAECFARTILALDGPVRLVVGEADHEPAAAVEAALARLAGGPWRGSLGRLEQPPLEELAARLAGCRAYLGNDSGVSHLAGLCGARSIVLFGPTSARVWAPLGPRVQVLPFDSEPNAVARALHSEGR